MCTYLRPAERQPLRASLSPHGLSRESWARLLRAEAAGSANLQGHARKLQLSFSWLLSGGHAAERVRGWRFPEAWVMNDKQVGQGLAEKARSSDGTQSQQNDLTRSDKLRSCLPQQLALLHRPGDQRIRYTSKLVQACLRRRTLRSARVCLAVASHHTKGRWHILLATTKHMQTRLSSADVTCPCPVLARPPALRSSHEGGSPEHSPKRPKRQTGPVLRNGPLLCSSPPGHGRPAGNMGPRVPAKARVRRPKTPGTRAGGSPATSQHLTV